MVRVICALAAVALLSASADAGPFRRTVVRSSTQTCVNGDCGSSSAVSRSRTVVRGSTATAQGVAELQAAEGACRHHGGNTGYEGVGCGPTPEAALAACCRGGGAVVDQGVAQGHDGRWYACRRYGR